MRQARTSGPRAARPRQLGVLQRLFVCITFHWASTKLSSLKVVLDSFADYPTETAISVVCDQPEYLKAALSDYPQSHLQIHRSVQELSHPYRLAWISRNVMQAAYQEGNHTLFIYMEPDLELKWPALQAWAQDEELLAPLGFHRGFVRTEIAQWSGITMAFDQREHTIVASDDSPILAVDIAGSSELHSSRQAGNGTAHFVQLDAAYMAMWLAPRQQLAAWMSAAEWTPDLDTLNQRSLREEAAFNVYRIHEKRHQSGRFDSSLVVPYDPGTLKIPGIATLTHLSNNYCDTDGSQQAVLEAAHAFCTIPLDDVLQAESRILI